MDPIQRMLLMSTYEALETAGYSPNRTLSTHSCRIASFFGQASDDAREVNIRAGVEVHFIPSIQRAFYPGRLNYHFGWEGASYSVDSACSSSSTAVLLACNALLARQCDTAVAGGGQLLGSPFIFSGLSKGSFLSKTGNCKSFQDSADGYCRGEGVGVVVLKRLEDAIADNDNVLAVIRGGARNFSARAISIIHPSVEAQQSLYQELLLQSGVSAEEVGYVEMHATATQAGDVAEMQSVASIFGVDRAPDNPLYVGGVKASVGHGEAVRQNFSLIANCLCFTVGCWNHVFDQIGPYAQNKDHSRSATLLWAVEFKVPTSPQHEYPYRAVPSTFWRCLDTRRWETKDSVKQLRCRGTYHLICVQL